MGQLRRRLGWGLILVSPIPWLAILVVPFLGWSIGPAILSAIGLALVADALFMAGALIVAPDIVRDRRRIWNRLLGRKDPPTPANDPPSPPHAP
jgi:hypothetical protein